MLLVRVRSIRRWRVGNLQTGLRGLCPPSQWDAWGNPRKLLRLRCFWRRMTPVSSRVSNCSLMAAERRSNRVARPCAEEHRYGPSNHSDDGFAQSAGRIREGKLPSGADEFTALPRELHREEIWMRLVMGSRHRGTNPGRREQGGQSRSLDRNPKMSC